MSPVKLLTGVAESRFSFIHGTRFLSESWLENADSETNLAAAPNPNERGGKSGGRLRNRLIRMFRRASLLIDPYCSAAVFVGLVGFRTVRFRASRIKSVIFLYFRFMTAKFRRMYSESVTRISIFLFLMHIVLDMGL